MIMTPEKEAQVDGRPRKAGSQELVSPLPAWKRAIDIGFSLMEIGRAHV